MSGFLVFDTRDNHPDYVAAQTQSSEDADYPIENALDLERRKRVWRSGGFFKVVSGSNTLVFREQAGVDLTATIAASSYASDALFFAAVKTALEDAGVGTYVVSRDATTARIKIQQSVSGGATVFQLQLTDAASAAVAALLGFDTAANRTGATTYEADLIRIHSEEWVMWDLGGPVNPTAFIAVTDRNRPLQISPGATLKIQGNPTNNFDAPLVDLSLTYSDYVIQRIASSGLASNTYGYRYWRFQIIDNDNPDGYVELGAIFLGRHIVTTRGCPGFPFESNEIDLSEVQYSEGGQAMSGSRPLTEEFSLNWNGLNIASKELLENLWKSFGRTNSFFICMDNDEVFSSAKAEYVRLVRFTGEPRKTLISVGIWAYTMPLREQL